VIIESGALRSSRRVLVLGGSRSGKSRYAERLAAATGPVTYVATATSNPADPDWAARIERHRLRRPAAWETSETRELAKLLARGEAGGLLIDSITTWLSGVLDDCGCWSDPPAPDSEQRLRDALDDLVQAWTGTRQGVIAVSDEVGSGVVPPTESGRRFRDLLGDLNQRLAASADEVWLVTAGIPNRLR
jgi:adenosylcobinamide kinase/adenosylcobinamide-phosphate guanylyltransferase